MKLISIVVKILIFTSIIWIATSPSLRGVAFILIGLSLVNSGTRCRNGSRTVLGAAFIMTLFSWKLAIALAVVAFLFLIGRVIENSIFS